MNQEAIIKNLENLDLKSSKVFHYLSSRPTEKETEYLVENYLINTRNRLTNELNCALGNMILNDQSYELLDRSCKRAYKTRISDCASSSSSFGSKNVSNLFRNNQNDLNFKSNEHLLNFKSSIKNGNQLKTFSSKIDIDLFDSSKFQSLSIKNTNLAHAHNTIKNNVLVNQNKFAPSEQQNDDDFDSHFNSINKPTNKFFFNKSNSLQSSNQNSDDLASFSNSNTNIGPSAASRTKDMISKYSSITPMASVGYKRKKKCEDEADLELDYENIDTGITPLRDSFKSGRELLQSGENKKSKKFGPTLTLETKAHQHTSYQAAKKSMMNPTNGASFNPPKRVESSGSNSKFKLPIPNTAKNNDDPVQVQHSDDKTNKKTQLEYLANIDQKLIDIIENEIMDKTPPISWDDIAGLKEPKERLNEIVIWPMLRPDLFNGLRGPPAGILLFGPPGTGKTLIAKCIANESKATFFNISSSTLTSKWQGESEKLVKVLFEVARNQQPAVIFIDEIDSLLSQRSDEDRESSRRLKTEFFVQMDGARTNGDERILLVGATNRPEELDDAARRRLIKRLYISLPQKDGRLQIVKNLMRKQECSLTEEEMDNIAKITDGYSGSDMTNLCREAAIGPIRSIQRLSITSIKANEVRGINHQDFIDAMKQVRASVSKDAIDSYEKWNQVYGSR